MKIKRITIAAAILAAICSCGNTAQEPTSAVQSPETSVTEEKAATTSETGTLSIDNQTLLSKGVVCSATEVPVFSKIEGQLLDITLKEGQRVVKGQRLFSLEDRDLKAKVDLCEMEREQAELKMEDILVSQGYKRGEVDNIPERIMMLARTKSGLNVSETELAISRETLTEASIRASVSGIVTGIRKSPYSYVTPGETLCTIVDPTDLIVRFSILETELRKFEKGTTIRVRSIAYSEDQHSAVVDIIGSVVDERGMVEIEAKLTDCERLLPGMTVIINLDE